MEEPIRAKLLSELDGLTHMVRPPDDYGYITVQEIVHRQNVLEGVLRKLLLEVDREE